VGKGVGGGFMMEKVQSCTAWQESRPRELRAHKDNRQKRLGKRTKAVRSKGRVALVAQALVAPCTAGRVARGEASWRGVEFRCPCWHCTSRQAWTAPAHPSTRSTHALGRRRSSSPPSGLQSASVAPPPRLGPTALQRMSPTSESYTTASFPVVRHSHLTLRIIRRYTSLQSRGPASWSCVLEQSVALQVRAVLPQLSPIAFCRPSGLRDTALTLLGGTPVSL
jgi:hypothetical protein